MDLRSIDLNLLVILDALLEEAHVTRAANRLALSQPATSSALERCRHLFGDRLLERGTGRMRLTPKAQALRAPLKQALLGLSGILDPSTPDLKTLRRTVRVAMADLPAASLIVPLHQRLRRSAPGIDLVFMPWHSAADALHRLEQGDIDLAVSVIPETGAEFRRVEILRESYVVAMRAGHPAAKQFDLDAWLAHPHVLVSARGETRGALDDALLKHGRTRRVGIVVPSFLVVLPLLEKSDFIAMIPGRAVPASSRRKLAVFQPPIPIDGFALHVAWHRRQEADLAVQHVAHSLRDALQA